uniref:C2H2-type domain-containing protein n=1 Tax=Spongospora subterranea TaxID=70186 RepID=A0A0H5RC55_9EUKA|eukprot:CRZ11623.1 hypothetical protein [Spongospora subterranea]
MDALDNVLAPTKAMASGGRAAEGVIDESAQALLTLASAASPDGKPVPAPGQAFQCSVCQKLFNKSSDMKRHKKGHSGERPFNCSTCQKAFLKASDLKRHTRIHTGERPYRCLICGRAFAEGGSLQRHTRMHTGERPYACSICDKRFVRSYNAKKHMKMHKGADPEVVNLGKNTVKKALISIPGQAEAVKAQAIPVTKKPQISIKTDSSPWLYQSVSTPPASNTPKNRSPAGSPLASSSAFAQVMSPISIPAPMPIPVPADLLVSGITARILQQ